MTIQRRPNPTQDELETWIVLCERQAKLARQKELRPQLVREGEQGPNDDASFYADSFEHLVAYLRDLI